MTSHTKFLTVPWRAIDANGDALDIVVQTCRNARAAKRFVKRLVAKFCQPKVVITDRLRSYINAIKTVAPDADQRAHKGLNNAIEVSHKAVATLPSIHKGHVCPLIGRDFDLL